MKRLFFTAALFVSLIALPMSAEAAFLDLSSWSELTLDLGGGQPAGNWDLTDGDTTVTQTINADPSFYLNNLNQTSYEIDGTWQVLPGAGDDDFIGFVFGYAGPNQTYVFDWKAGNQVAGGYGDALEGFTVRKINAPNVGSLALPDFWDKDGTSNTTILDSSWSTTSGWVHGTEYDFHLEFDPGVVVIEVKEEDTILFNTTINDDMYQSGQFGFYNFSQQNVKYAGFEQTGGVIVDPVIPEPGTMSLMGMGLLGGAAFRRKKKRA